MANDVKKDALTTLRGIIAANAAKARLFGQGDTIAAIDAVLVEIAQRQRTIANAVCVLDHHVNLLARTADLRGYGLTEEMRGRLRVIFEAGDITPSGRHAPVYPPM